MQRKTAQSIWISFRIFQTDHHGTGEPGRNAFKTVSGTSAPKPDIDPPKRKDCGVKRSNREPGFSAGGTANGVTAASAITMLQQAGEKLSRAMIDDSYDAYKKIVVLCIELMREFYKEERIYRITNDQGEKAFAALSNDMLLKAEEERDAFGFPIGTIYRNAEFDVEVLPQRQNPFTREMNNQTVMTLYQAGFFNPQNLEMSLVALEAMQFDGKEKIMQRMQEINAQNQLVQEQMAQAQAAASGGGQDSSPRRSYMRNRDWRD